MSLPTLHDFIARWAAPACGFAAGPGHGQAGRDQGVKYPNGFTIPR
jgi:hypothetical protein